MLPVTMVLLLCNTFWELIVPAGSAAGRVINVILALIGAVVAISFIIVATRGFVRRRREVGYLAVEALPGG